MFPLLILGCNPPTDDATAAPDFDYPVDTGIDLTPATGKWVYETLNTTSPRCQELAELLPFAVGENFKIFQVDNRSFLTSLPDVERSVRCDLLGASFLCEELITESPVDGYSITLVTSMVMLGTFLDEATTEGRYELVVDCEGSVCGAAAAYYGLSFPCDMTVSYSAGFQ